MQRLSRPDRRDERGVSAVIVALMLAVLVGFGALAVDLGALWSDKKQLQNGADAGALAIAQACAGGACGDTAGDADRFAAANKFDGNATGEVVSLAANRVVVRTDTHKDAWLGRIFSIDTLRASATSAAVWGSPQRAVTLPFAASGCWFSYQTGSMLGVPPPVGTPFAIPLMSKSSSPGDVACGTQAAHNETAGGFGWLKPDGGGCAVTIDLANPWVRASTGQPAPCDVSTVLAPGDTVLMPLFDRFRGSGANAEYRVYVFAAFRVSGYCFGPQDSSAPGWPSCQSLVANPKDKGRNIRGTFVKFVDLGEALELGGPNAGVSSVKLELP